MGVLAIMRFPMDARHPVARSRMGRMPWGKFSLHVSGPAYYGRVIERLVSRADGLVELHAGRVAEENAPEGESL